MLGMPSVLSEKTRKSRVDIKTRRKAGRDTPNVRTHTMMQTDGFSIPKGSRQHYVVVRKARTEMVGFFFFPYLVHILVEKESGRPIFARTSITCVN